MRPFPLSPTPTCSPTCTARKRQPKADLTYTCRMLEMEDGAAVARAHAAAQTADAALRLVPSSSPSPLTASSSSHPPPASPPASPPTGGWAADLSYTRLTQLPAAALLADARLARTLVHLNAADNKIARLPAAACRQWTALRVLLLRYNKIATLPSDIGRLAYAAVLWTWTWKS